MISIRRFIASILAGALLVLVSAAQASAQPVADFDRALDGVALGLAAAAEVTGDSDVIVLDESLIVALGVYDAWLAKHEEAGRVIRGEGPVNAQAVHEALLAEEIPGQLVKESGSKLSELAGAYDVLRGKSDEAKAAKDAKDKSNNGKSDDKSNNGKSEGKSQSDKDSSESSRGQQNRP
jgi:hypothetical protein